MKRLEGKNALITGVGRPEGIGAAICRKLASEGVNIFYTYWHVYDMEQFPKTDAPDVLLEELHSIGGVSIDSIEVDLSTPDAAAKLFAAAKERYGGIDILINNACYDREAPYKELTGDILDAHYAVNLRAPTLLCAEFIKAWQKPSGGKIINLTSGQSLGPMNVDQIPYTITKAGLEMLAKQLAPAVYERGITVNAVDPGPTDTGWMDEATKEKLRRGLIINQPDEIADAIDSLLLDEAADTTGAVIHVGRTNVNVS